MRKFNGMILLFAWGLAFSPMALAHGDRFHSLQELAAHIERHLAEPGDYEEIAAHARQCLEFARDLAVAAGWQGPVNVLDLLRQIKTLLAAS